MNHIVNIDMSKKCLECGDLGATDSGICMKCAVKAIRNKPMKSAAGKAVQARMRQIKAADRSGT